MTSLYSWNDFGGKKSSVTRPFTVAFLYSEPVRSLLEERWCQICSEIRNQPVSLTVVLKYARSLVLLPLVPAANVSINNQETPAALYD